MTATVIALVTINDEEPRALAQYLEATGTLLENVGAHIRQRFTIKETVAGKLAPQSVIVVDYPSEAAVRAVFDSDTYRRIVPVRDRAFLSYSVSVACNAADIAHAKE